MKKFKFKRRLGVVVAMVAVLVLGLAGTAGAVAVFLAGSSTAQQRDLTETNATLVPVAAGWHNVPSTGLFISVPSGTTRVVESSFTAESLCLGASWCSARVVAINSATGGVIEFNPVVGTDYAFDSPADSWEGHAMQRAFRLPAGNYTVLVQATVVGPGAGAQFRIDDYAHFVDVLNP